MGGPPIGRPLRVPWPRPFWSFRGVRRRTVGRPSTNGNAGGTRLVPALFARGSRLRVTGVVVAQNVPAAHGYLLSVRNGGRLSGPPVCNWLSKCDSFLPVYFNRILRLIA